MLKIKTYCMVKIYIKIKEYYNFYYNCIRNINYYKIYNDMNLKKHSIKILSKVSPKKYFDKIKKNIC